MRDCFSSISVAGLQALRNKWDNVPLNWVGADPCGNSWDGISFSKNHVVSITLASIDLRGQLSSDINNLPELQIIILVGCGFSGAIPPSIGSLQKLVYLSLNSNNFIGGIPPSIGSLSKLYWMDLADNKLTRSLPISDGSTPVL